VLAVLPAGFRGPSELSIRRSMFRSRVWVMWAPDERNTPRTVREFELYARLRPGATMDQAAGQLQALSADMAAKYPQANSGRSLSAIWQTKAEGGGVQVLSILVLAIAGAVLLIACTNIANLLLALNDSRRREIAMRAALGATRGMLLRQLVTEYAVLAGLRRGRCTCPGTMANLAGPALLPNVGYPLGFDFRIDHRVLAFTALAGVVSVLVCGLIPALATTRTSPLDAMRAQLPHTGRLRMPARKVFAVAQLAISMSLLIATGLLIRALIHIESMDLGFNSGQNAILLGIGVDGQGPQRQAEFDALVTRMKALPGVKDASVARVVPFPESGGGARKSCWPRVRFPRRRLELQFGSTLLMMDTFAHEWPLVRGRVFGTQDTAASRRVVIVNQTLAKKLFGTADVVGRHVRLGRRSRWMQKSPV